jgi:hypothetical protein
MSDAVVLSGSIIAGPTGAGDCGFPSGITNIVFSSYPPQKSSGAKTSNSKTVNSASVYVALDGVGTGETVTQGNFLYLRSTSPLLVRLTTQPTSGGDVVAVVPIHGVMILEFPAANYLKLLEVQGVGTVEYLVSGNQ